MPESLQKLDILFKIDFRKGEIYHQFIKQSTKHP